MSNNSAKSVRQLQKTATRARILAHAKRVCARRGFVRTRTLDVAQAAGVSHGSVFLHFPSREELMTAVVAEMAREFTDRLHALAAGGGSLAEVLGAHLQCLAERESQVRWLVVEAPLLSKGFHASWLSLLSAVSFHIAHAAEREMAAGQIKVMPVHLLFNTWIGLVHHYVANRELYAPSGSVLRNHGFTLLEHFLRLVARPPAEAPKGDPR